MTTLFISSILVLMMKFIDSYGSLALLISHNYACGSKVFFFFLAKSFGYSVILTMITTNTADFPETEKPCLENQDTVIRFCLPRVAPS